MLLVLAAAATVVQSASNPDRLEGTVEVALSPNRVIELLSDYEKWPEIFSDVKSAKIVSTDGGTLVRLDTKSAGHPHTFRMESGAERVAFEITDGHNGNLKIKGEFQVEATSNGTRVDGVFETKVGGWMGRLLPDSKIRKMARAKLERDLRDLEKRLADEERNQPATAAHVDHGVSARTP